MRFTFLDEGPILIHHSRREAPFDPLARKVALGCFKFTVGFAERSANQPWTLLATFYLSKKFVSYFLPQNKIYGNGLLMRKKMTRCIFDVVKVTVRVRLCTV